MLGGLVAAMLPVLFSCGGWQFLGYAASEVREPQRVLPRAIVLGVGGVLAVYLLLNLDYLRVLGLEGMAGDFGFAAEVARLTFGARGGEALKVAMAVSAVGVCTVTTLVTPWIYVAMARDGSFFESFGRLHPRTGAPVLALCLQCAMAVVYVLVGDVNFLVDSVVFVEWIFHAAVAWGLIALRRRRPDLPRPFRSPAWPLMPALYLLAAVFVVGGNLWRSDVRTTGTGLGVVALGLVVHPLWRRYFERRAAGGAAAQ